MWQEAGDAALTVFVNPALIVGPFSRNEMRRSLFLVLLFMMA